MIFGKGKSNIERRLLSLKLRGLHGQFDIHSETEIRDFAISYGLLLPESYAGFLKQYGTSVFGEDVYYRPIEKSLKAPDDGLEEIDIFYGLSEDEYDLRRIIPQFKERIPENLIPIAEVPGGDQVCLGIKGADFAKIFLWEHDHPISGKNVYLVADSFEAFIQSLEIRKADFNRLPRAKSVWIDEDL